MKPKREQLAIIQRYEYMLTDPRLGVEAAGKLFHSMMNETRRFVDRPDKLVIESENRNVKHGLFKKESS